MKRPLEQTFVRSGSLIDLIDTHTHLTAADFAQDLDAVIARAQAAGVGRFISIGASEGLDSARDAIRLAQRFDFIWASAGVHPHDADQDLDRNLLVELANSKRVVAIGETGLDSVKGLADPKNQEKWFEFQVSLAKELKLPLIIHCRGTAERCLDILRINNAQAVGGVFHCYSEDYDFACKLQELGFLISLPGILTFKKAEELRDTVRRVSLEQIMLETDAPYLAPEPFRGKRCESSQMLETAKVLAQIKGLSLEEISKATTANALRLFKLT